MRGDGPSFPVLSLQEGDFRLIYLNPVRLLTATGNLIDDEKKLFEVG